MNNSTNHDYCNNLYITLLKNKASPIKINDALIKGDFIKTFSNKRTTIYENKNASISFDKKIIRINIYDSKKLDFIHFIKNYFDYGENLNNVCK